MWGGSAVTMVSAIAVIYVWMVTPPPEGDSGAPMTLYAVLILAGLAAAVIGWLLERRKGSSGP